MKKIGKEAEFGRSNHYEHLFRALIEFDFCVESFFWRTYNLPCESSIFLYQLLSFFERISCGPNHLIAFCNHFSYNSTIFEYYFIINNSITADAFRTSFPVNLNRKYGFKYIYFLDSIYCIWRQSKALSEAFSWIEISNESKFNNILFQFDFKQ